MRSIAALAFAGQCGLVQAELTSIRFDGFVMRFDEATGAHTIIASSGLAQTYSMAAFGGQFYTASGGNLYRINPNTGADDIRGLAFDGTGQL